MQGLDRSAVIAIAVALTLSFAAWQLLNSIGYVASELLVDWWENDTSFGSFGAEFSIGGVKVEYGPVLSALITLLVALAVAIPFLRYARRRTAAPASLS